MSSTPCCLRQIQSRPGRTSPPSRRAVGQSKEQAAPCLDSGGSVHGERYDNVMSYQPPFDWMAWDLRSPTENDKPPPSIRNAVGFMYAGAALAALSLILSLALIRAVVRNAGATVQVASPVGSQLHLVEAVAVSFVVVEAMIRIGLWLWMARRNYAGRGWARILSTVLFALSTLSSFEGIVRPARAGAIVVSLPWSISGDAIGVALWLAGLCAITLLWQRPSSEFFAARSRRY
jgi:hypothetical protein